MYRRAIDAWQKGYNGSNDFAQTSRPQQGQTNAAFNPAAAYENTSAQMQKTDEHIFRGVVEHQVELGRFFGKRQARYLDFWSDIAHCQSAADKVKLQSAFLTEMAADYGIESRRLRRASKSKRTTSTCYGWCERPELLPPIFTPCLMAKTRRAGRDQPLNGLNLISEATLNVLEPGGDREITAVAEERLYVGHEQVGFLGGSCVPSSVLKQWGIFRG